MMDQGEEKAKRRFDWVRSVKEPKEGDPIQTSIPMTAFNLTNCILGSGIIGVSFGLRESGFGLGIVLLPLVALITDYTLRLLIRAGLLCGCGTYQQLMRKAFGPVGYATMSILQFMYPFIAMVGYHIIIADQISRLMTRIGEFTDVDSAQSTFNTDDLRDQFWGERYFISGVITILLLIPLSLYRNIAALSKWAMISIVATVVIVVIFAIRATTLDLERTDDAFEFADIEFVQGIGIFTYAFVCHHSSFLMFDVMRKPTQRRWNEVTDISMAFCLAVTLTVGILGYLMFTGNTQGDILENFCSDDDLVNVGRGLFAMTIIISFPVELFVARDVLERSVSKDETPPTLCGHITLTTILVLLSYGASLITQCLGIVLEFNGIVAATPLAFIFPPLLVLRLQPRETPRCRNIPLYLVLLFGIFVFVTGLYVTIDEILDDEINGIECTQGQEPAYCLTTNISMTTVSMEMTTF